MSFAGGHHYAFEAGGIAADFFFLPVSASDPRPAASDFGWVRLAIALGAASESLEPVVMNVELSSEAAFAAGLDVVDGVIIGALTLDPLASGVQGPLYQPACGFESDALGNSVPGACACRFPTAAIEVPLYVPLGPLFGDEPASEPSPADAGAF